MKPSHTYPSRIFYDQTDATGVMYHAHYITLFERARTHWLQVLGISQEKMKNELGVCFTIASLQAHYFRPAKLDDEVIVTVTLERARRASMEFSQTMVYASEPDVVLATLTVRAGCVDMAKFRPCAMPAAVLALLEQHV
jgi:acyl-CoA thioester hydrolase